MQPPEHRTRPILPANSLTAGKSGMPGTAIDALVIGLAVLLIVVIAVGAYGRL